MRYFNFLVFSILFVYGHAQHIKPQASLGVGLKQAPKNKCQAPLIITSVQHQSTAENLGIQTGDILCELNGRRLTSLDHLKKMIKGLTPDMKLTAQVLREGTRKNLKGVAVAKRPEFLTQNSETILTEVPVGDGYVRAYINKPLGKGPFPVIYYIQGYPCNSINYTSEHPTMQFLKGMLNRGFAVFRVEKPGVGEHYNCKPCLQYSFADEVQLFKNGYDLLVQKNFIDKDMVFVFGHSLGGNVAPLLAQEKKLKGLVTYGTVAKPWKDYLVDMARYSTPMLLNNFTNNEDRVKKIKAVNDKIYNAISLEELSEKELQVLRDNYKYDGSDKLFDRHISFWTELNNINFTEEWHKVATPVLALHGESDLHAINALEAEHIANIVNASAPGAAVSKIIPNSDHFFLNVTSKNESAEILRTGQLKEIFYQRFNPAIIEDVTQWIHSLDTSHKAKLLTVANERLEIDKTSISTMDVEFADLDADGDIDIIIATEFGPNKIFFKQSGKYQEVESKSLTPLREYQAPYFGEDSEDIAIADFNQDGLTDLLFVSEDSQNHELYFNTGKGNFQIAKAQIPKIGQANAVLIHDFNKDNYPDVLMGIRGHNELYINQKDETFVLQTKDFISVNEDSTQDLILLDIENDGDLDIVEGTETGGSNIYINKDGKFQEDKTRLPDMTAYETRKVVSHDINGDGFTDLFFCNVGWTPDKNPQNIWLINNGKGHFNVPETVFLPKDSSTTLDALIYDFNQDGLKDILTTNFGDDQNLKLLLNVGSRSEPKYEFHDTLLPRLYFKAGVSLKMDVLSGIVYLGNYQSKDILLELNGLNSN